MNDLAPAGSGLGPLPRWSLADLYESPSSPAIDADLARAKGMAEEFRRRWEGKLAGATGEALAEAVRGYEALQDLLGRIGSYAQLLYAGDMTDPAAGRFQQTIQERTTDISAETIFFALELNKLDDKDITTKLEAPGLAHYRPWIETVRAFRPHQLSDEVERLLHDKSVVGRAAWNRLFDESLAMARFSVEGRELTIDETLNQLTDRDGARRKAAAKALATGLDARKATLALITNTLAKDKEIEYRWRHFARPVSSRNLGNQVEDEVVEALRKSVTGAYPRLSHRYYKIKAKWFGGESLDYWDRKRRKESSLILVRSV